jgi:hypothetical protein
LRPLDLRALRKSLHKALECLLERGGIEHAEHTAERIVARQPVLEHQQILPKIGLHPRKKRHVGATRRTAQGRHQGDEQNLRQIVQRIVRARVGQLRKTLRKSFHQRRPSNQEPPSESISAKSAITYKFPHAIPLPSSGRAWQFGKQRPPAGGQSWGKRPYLGRVRALAVPARRAGLLQQYQSLNLVLSGLVFPLHLQPRSHDQPSDQSWSTSLPIRRASA